MDGDIIDTHVHVGLAKYGPIEDYVGEMDRLGLRRAVLVQYVGNHDDAYLAAGLRAYPGRFAAIGSIDPEDPTTHARLATHVRATGIQGLRLAPTARSPGPDPLAIWRRADDLALIVSVRGPFEEVIDQAFAAIVAACPRIRFRFEHLGWYNHASEPPPYRRFSRFLRLADHPNTSVVWSGFYLNSASPYPYATSRPIVELAYRAFGADRTMWSGDWNRPDVTTDVYRREMTIVGDSFAVASDADRARIMGGTAASFFDFHRQPIFSAGGIV
jgi:predicted TIM-barrel fold metal-dependent hydrolase